MHGMSLSYDAKSKRFEMTGVVVSPHDVPADPRGAWKSEDPWFGPKTDHFYLDGKMYSSGKHSVFCPISDELGLKIGFGPRKGTVRRASHMRPVRKVLRRYARMGIGPGCYDLVSGRLDVIVYSKRFTDGFKINQTAFGMLMDIVHRPYNARFRLVKGAREYDFSVLDLNEHPEHCPKGVARFVEDVIVKSRPRKRSELRIGNIGYCIRKKRWFLMDSMR